MRISPANHARPGAYTRTPSERGPAPVPDSVGTPGTLAVEPDKGAVHAAAPDAAPGDRPDLVHLTRFGPLEPPPGR
jgi:hypothetical protein